jgi:hypothetical protein
MYSQSGHRAARANVQSGLVSLRVGAACIVLAGCSGGPSVTLNTAAGQTPIHTPSGGQSGGLASPPQIGQPVSGPTDRSGTYAGTATPLNTAGGLCISSRKISGFRVRGTSVRFGAYRGTIDANGGVQLVAGHEWIIGQFEGPVFYGQLDMTGQGGRGYVSGGCSYMLSLERIGP